MDVAFGSLAQRHLEGGSFDLIVQATAVKGEVLIEQRRYAEAVKQCLGWTQRDRKSETVDKTDEAWVNLVLWKAYLYLNDVDGAKECERHWLERRKDIENAHILALAATVTGMQLERDTGFFISAARSSNARHWSYKDWNKRLREFWWNASGSCTPIKLSNSRPNTSM